MGVIDFSGLDVRVEEHVPLGPLTTYKLGGAARWFAEPGTEDELSQLVRHAVTGEVAVVVIGRGSNMLVSDDGFDGLAIRLGPGFGGMSIDADGVVTGGAAVPLPRLARFSVEHGCGGIEFLVGVPGSVGGAVRMNAGCFGSETSEWMVDARLLDIDRNLISVVTARDLEMGYRTTRVTSRRIVLSARFRTVPRPTEEGKATLLEITRWRRDNQPGGTLNAGSVFKNPDGDTAGRLIDASGLKGLSVGAATVSPRHANFIEAGPGATATQIYALIRQVARRVLDTTGVALEPEVRLVGRFEEGT